MKNLKSLYYTKKFIIQIIAFLFFLVMPITLYIISDNFPPLRIISFLIFIVLILFLLLNIVFFIYKVPIEVIIDKNNIIIYKRIGFVTINTNDITHIKYGLEKDLIIYYKNKKFDFIGISKEIQELVISSFNLNNYEIIQ